MLKAFFFKFLMTSLALKWAEFWAEKKLCLSNKKLLIQTISNIRNFTWSNMSLRACLIRGKGKGDFLWWSYLTAVRLFFLIEDICIYFKEKRRGDGKKRVKKLKMSEIHRKKSSSCTISSK